MAKKNAKPAKPAAKKKAPKAKKTVKKAAPKKTVKKKAKPKAKKKAAAPAPLPWRVALPGESLVGVVEDFFGHINVIAFTVQGTLRVGDKIHVRGHTTDISETVGSMQMEHQSLERAKSGDAVGIKTAGKCRAGDYIYKVG